MSEGTPSCVIVHTTVASQEAADALARSIVDARLAACVQVLPIRSVYRWQGAVEEAGEIRVEAKTQSSLAPELMRFIRERHAYETPELIAMPIVKGDADYLAWVRDETA